MDEATKQILVLLITTLGTLGVAWIKVRGPASHHHEDVDDPSPPAVHPEEEP